MKKYLMVALFALVSFVSIDAVAGTGFLENIPIEESALALATAGAAVAVPGKDALKNLRVVTQEEFNALEAKYKRLYILDITFDADEHYQFIARRPTKDVIQAMGESKDAPFKIADMMIKNMIVAGNMEDLEDGVVYSRVIELLTGIVKEGKKLFTRA